MSASLMEALQGLVTPAMLKTASSTLGEGEGPLTTGLGAIVSKVLGALNTSTNDQSLMGTVAQLVTQQTRDSGALTDISGLLTGSTPTSNSAIAGNRLIGSLFGVKEGGIAQSAAAAAGLKPQSGASLMALAGPLVLSALAKSPNAASMTGQSLASLLSGQGSMAAPTSASAAPVSSTVSAAQHAASSASNAVKTAANEAATATASQAAAAAAAVTGAAAAAARSASSTASTAASDARTAATETIRPTASAAGGAGLSWLLWFIPLVLLLGFGWFLWQTQQAVMMDKAKAIEDTKPAAAPGPEKKSEAPAPAATPVVAATPAPKAEPSPSVATDAGNGMMKISLPGGADVSYAKDGVEGQLINFLQDANSVIDKKTWFNFDRLNFETGSTTLTSESREQVSNIATVLKAFPTSAIKIGGYTDNVGNPESNLKLSDERAKKVMTELAALGIAGNRLDAEGYGEQFPVEPNDTAEGRAKNRRTALSVRAR